MLQVPSNNEYNSTSSVLKIEAEYFCFFIVFRALATNQFQLILSATIKIHDACRHPKNITNSLLWALTDTKTRKIFQITITHNKHTHTAYGKTCEFALHSEADVPIYCICICIFIDALSVANHAFFSRNSHVAPREWKADGNQKKTTTKSQTNFWVDSYFNFGQYDLWIIVFLSSPNYSRFFFFCSCCSVLMKDSWTKTMADTRWREEKIMLFNSKCDDCDSHMPFFCVFSFVAAFDAQNTVST